MAGFYFIDLIDVLDAAGVTVAVADVNAGWETRSRNSGGFPGDPVGGACGITPPRKRPRRTIWRT